jgi:hypothetical protein
MDDRDPLDRPPRDMADRGNFKWSMIALIAVLVAGLLFIANMRNNSSNTQVGRNVERPAINTQPPVTSPPTPR